ncbi:MAG: RNA polymerase sigma factor [Cyclobacteriaceae bacterium]|nr:RNA polymerase sigma factor [Cyclobacteriaceae bacterium]
MKQEAPAITQLTDEEEVIRQSVQNPENFRVLYERYYRNIFLFILHRVGDKPTTADLTSQVFFKALTNLSRYQFRGLPFSAWLYRIAVNECNELFRREKRVRYVVLEDGVAENLYEEIFTSDAKDELKEKLPYALERLRADELQLIELRYMESRPFREVAAILDITENNAKVKVYRVLDKMRKLLLK